MQAACPIINAVFFSVSECHSIRFDEPFMERVFFSLSDLELKENVLPATRPAGGSAAKSRRRVVGQEQRARSAAL